MPFVTIKRATMHFHTRGSPSSPDGRAVSAGETRVHVRRKERRRTKQKRGRRRSGEGKWSEGNENGEHEWVANGGGAAPSERTSERSVEGRRLTYLPVVSSVSVCQVENPSVASPGRLNRRNCIRRPVSRVLHARFSEKYGRRKTIIGKVIFSPSFFDFGCRSRDDISDKISFNRKFGKTKNCLTLERNLCLVCGKVGWWRTHQRVVCLARFSAARVSPSFVYVFTYIVWDPCWLCREQRRNESKRQRFQVFLSSLRLPPSWTCLYWTDNCGIRRYTGAHVHQSW